MITKSHCQTLDQNDALAPLRNEFDLPKNVTYLDGNSLGAQPKAALTRAQQVITQEWGQDLIRSWNSAGWFDMPSRLGDMLAPLIGANPAEVVVTDSTSVNLFKALAAALHLQAELHPHKKIIVSERSNFPTDLYMVQGLTQWLDRGYRLELVDSPEQLNSAINEHVAVALLTHVNYRTGEMLDMTSLTTHIHAQGALAIWDLCHSAGAVPVELNAANADFAIGCTYKYLNGGPGSPAFIWVAERHLAKFTHPLSGWWGHTAPFAMQPEFTPTASIRRALCGTQPMISLALVETGLAVFKKTSMTALREKSLALTDLFIQLVEQRCANHPLGLVTPRSHSKRGSHVSFTHPHAYPIIQALIERGIIGDYREPAVLRFGFTPLYTGFVDVWNAVEALRDILDTQAYQINATRHAVT
ncbi:kynureninase [Solimicrobium silvestre]|uniref:Kynureninase n=1 Tax=Solimicrobium silvestre TaxID=2099400 RepID=A0A2S9GT67_9BURK|nr:kynureninase [Solimicrobium silvestre]PRC90910.1 kynureninase: kynureninase [Solimicrobium silvestre]